MEGSLTIPETVTVIKRVYKVGMLKIAQALKLDRAVQARHPATRTRTIVILK